VCACVCACVCVCVFPHQVLLVNLIVPLTLVCVCVCVCACVCVFPHQVLLVNLIVPGLPLPHLALIFACLAHHRFKLQMDQLHYITNTLLMATSASSSSSGEQPEYEPGLQAATTSWLGIKVSSQTCFCCGACGVHVGRMWGACDVHVMYM
jgi:hypothetical protein